MPKVTFSEPAAALTVGACALHSISDTGRRRIASDAIGFHKSCLRWRRESLLYAIQAAAHFRSVSAKSVVSKGKALHAACIAACK